jgi:hypothetical protein
MITDLRSGETIVGRLRIEGAGVDSNLARLRVSSLLNNASLQSAQSAPSAIVFIRKFRDPLPRVLRLDQSIGHVPAVWDQAVKEALQRLTRNAARPALGAVPAGAESVVFLDRSELLACLASDWCEGQVTARWWWQSLLKQGEASQIVKEHWQRTPEYIPAALQQLAGRNKAADFVRALSVAETRLLLRSVIQSFALPSLMPVLNNFERADDTPRDPSTLNQLKTFERVGNTASRITPPAPWRAWVPETGAAGLTPEQEIFLGITLMLRRAPVKARALRFHHEVRKWQVALMSKHDPISRSSVVGLRAKSEQASRAGERARKYVSQQLDHSHDESTEEKRADVQVSNAISLPRAAAQEPSVSSTQVRAAGDNVDIDVVEMLGSPSSPEQEAEEQFRSPPTEASRPTEKFASALKGRTETQSIATKASETQVRKDTSPLPLRSVESTPAQSESSLRQTDPAPSPPAERPLLPRDETSSLQSFEAIAEKDWQDEEWIETQLGGVFYLINLGQSLGLYGDFTTPDEPGIQLNIWDFIALLGRELAGDEIESDPIWPLLARLAQREEGDLLGSGFEPEEDYELSDSKRATCPRVAAWVDRLMPYVRERLRKGLGLEAEDDPGPIVCRHPARVCLTPTHFDVYFSLARLPIAIRLSGLDRNPGWVPAAGRFIAFHFD